MSTINIASIVISVLAIALSAYSVITMRRTAQMRQQRVARTNPDSLLNVESRVARFDRFHDRSVMHVYDMETGAVLHCVEPERCEAHSRSYARHDQGVLPASTGAGNNGLEE